MDEGGTGIDVDPRVKREGDNWSKAHGPARATDY